MDEYGILLEKEGNAAIRRHINKEFVPNYRVFTKNLQGLSILEGLKNLGNDAYEFNVIFWGEGRDGNKELALHRMKIVNSLEDGSVELEDLFDKGIPNLFVDGQNGNKVRANDRYSFAFLAPPFSHLQTNIYKL